MNRIIAAVLTPLLLLPAVPASGQEIIDRAGVKLSPRERDASQRVVLLDGRVVLRPEANGIPFLFGLGDRYGTPSGMPTLNGVTPSVLASTASGGLVPGQSPDKRR